MEMVKPSGSFMKTFLVRACSLITNWNQAAGSVYVQNYAIATWIHYWTGRAADSQSKTEQEVKHSVSIGSDWHGKLMTHANSWPVCPRGGGGMFSSGLFLPFLAEWQHWTPSRDVVVPHRCRQFARLWFCWPIPVSQRQPYHHGPRN